MSDIHDIYFRLYREIRFDSLLAPSKQKVASKNHYHTVLAHHFGIEVPCHKVCHIMDRLDDTFINKLQKRVAAQSQDIFQKSKLLD